MKRFFSLLVMRFIQFVLRFRYRVRYKGLETLTPERLKHPGGVLFLPNHPTVFVDPSLVTIGIYKRFPIRPLVIEYMYYTTGIHWLMKHMKAIPVPNLHQSTNSVKIRRSERALEEVVKGLSQGDNFLIYPAGRVKRSNYELIGGASGVHTILQKAPNTNVVLVRVTGLYGSSFSSALTGGKVPFIFPVILRGIWIALKNFLFFTPRREVTVEYCPAPPDFPYHASRIAFNRYLEQWYNRPDGIDSDLAGKSYPGESLSLVSYSCFRRVLPVVPVRLAAAEEVSLDRIPKAIQDKVVAKLAEIAKMPEASIQPDMQLASNLGLDSLDASEILTFLQDAFGVVGVPPSALTTVGEVMSIAAKQNQLTQEEQEAEANVARLWQKSAFPHAPVKIPEGNTIPEVFFNQCARMGHLAAIGDARSGVLSYADVKLRVILLASVIRAMPGHTIGIMLPASTAASIVILATQLAGKVPVLVNWTVGSRHLEAVVEQSGIQTVMSSWAFLDRLENVDLTPIHDMLFFLEDLKSQIGIVAKLKAFVLSKLSRKKLFSFFSFDPAASKSQAVILFTSGTESMPKGVPLTHANILSNQRGSIARMSICQDDVLLSTLPPFHSFGFTIGSLIALLSGCRTAYYPNPMEGPELARCLPHWGATILCGPPTFIRAIMKSATEEQMRSVRLIVTGAEKATPEFLTLLTRFGKLGAWVEGYGITECSPVLTASDLTHSKVGVGRPLPDVSIIIRHPETLQEVGMGEDGLILVRGPNVFDGYLQPQGSSPFVTVDGQQWYRTGDLGHLDAEGNLTISGRLKRFFKVGGELISLGGIESALLEVAPQYGWELAEEGPSLAVIGDEEQPDKPRLILFTRFSVALEQVNNALRKLGFSNLVRIHEVHTLAALPVMGTGKIHYRELQSKVEALKKKQSTFETLACPLPSQKVEGDLLLYPRASSKEVTR